MGVTVGTGAGAGRPLVAVGDGQRLRIGRGRDCDLMISDPKASRHHAELTCEGNGRVVLTDLGSRNGTWIDGSRLDHPVALAGTEKVWIGDTVLRLKPNGAGPIAAPAAGAGASPEGGPPSGLLRRAASGVADAVILRPSLRAAAGAALPAATEQAISRSLKLGAIVLFAVTGGLTAILAGVETGPVVFGAAALMAFLAVPFYVAAALWIDRNEREPMWMVWLTFFWGATAAVFIALTLNTLGELIVSSSLDETAGAIYGYSISAPIVEETAKAAALLIIYRRLRGEFNGVLDGIVYAAIVGLGFATTENVFYYGRGAVNDGVPGAVATFIGRGVLSPFAHPLFTAMTGIGLGIASVAAKRSTRIGAPLLGLGGAIALHSLWNTSALLGAIVAVYPLVMVPLFAGVLLVIKNALKRERQVLVQHLLNDVAFGALTSGELAVLADGRARRAALREARFAGGKPARELRRQYHQAAMELAFLRERITRGLIPWDAVTAERHCLYEAVLRDARYRLGALLWLPRAAFVGAPVSGQPPAPPPAALS